MNKPKIKTKVVLNKKACNGIAKEAFSNFISENAMEIKCPHCNSTINVKLGDNVCSNCNNRVILEQDKH